MTLTHRELERFVKPLLDYFYRMEADDFRDVRPIAVEMLHRIGVTSEDDAFWETTERGGMYRDGRLTPHPEETRAFIESIYGPREFHEAQEIESILNWAEATQ